MAVIHVYDGITSKKTYTFNGKLRDHLRGVDWEKSIILRGGFRLNPDYEVQPNDTIFIRRTPGSAVAVAVVIGVTALIVGGVAIGETVHQRKVAQQQAEAASKAAKAAGEQTNKLPFVRGTRNQPATGQTFPFAMGRSLMTPYRLCPAHYTIAGTDGSEQYYNAVLEIAYNNILINSVKMGETVIKDFTGVTEPQNGQYSFDPGVYYDERNLLEIRQTGAFTDDNFNKKIILTELNEEIPHDHATDDPDENAKIEQKWRAGVVQELPNNAQSVEVIALFDGLRKYDDGWQAQTIELSPQWTNVNNPQESDWHDFTNGFNQNGTISNTFTRTTKKQMRFAAVQTFTAAQAYNKTMKVRVRRLTPKADSNANDTVYLMAVQTTCYDAKKSTANNLVTAEVIEPEKRDQCCRIGVRIAANSTTEGLLDVISVIETACARTWNGSAWSETKTPTRNLAAWMLEVLTSPHHKPSQYADEELDLDTFGALYEYCETMGFYADGVITDNAKKKDILNTLCKNANCTLVYNRMTGLIEVAIDNGRDYSVALLNSENIISISTVKEFKRKTTGKKVTYINAAAGYDMDNVIFMRDGGEYDPATDTLTETALKYVTDYEQAFKIAWREMAEEMAQPRIITIRAGLESAYYPIYSRVEVQHQSLKNGLAHGVIRALTWRNSYLQQIELEGPVTFPANTACGVIINCVSADGHGILPLKVSGTGKTNILTVETTLRSNAPLIPAVGNNISFGELDNDGNFTTVTTSMKITNAEESENGYTLTLVDYNPALYEYGTLPEYKSNITTQPNSRQQTVEDQRDYITEGTAQATASEAAQEAVNLITRGVRFSNVYKISGVPTLQPGTRQPLTARDSVPNIINTLESLRAEIDDVLRQATDGISITDDKITISVSDSEKKTTALIEVTAAEIRQLVSDEIEGTVSYIDQTAETINARIETDEGTITQLGLDVDGLTTRVQNAEGDISALDQDVDNISARVQDAEGDISQLEIDINGLSSRVQSAEGDITSLNQNVTGIEARVQTNEGAITQLNLDVTGLTSTVQSNDQKQTSRIEQTQNGLIAMIDDALRNAQAGISLTADGLTIQIQDTEKQLRSTIQITAGEILEEVDDLARELTGLIDIQAGAVTALVEGGGAAGEMSLSLNLPVMIDATTRAAMVTASTEAKVAAVYALVENTNYYAIKGNASNAAVKALWDDAITGGLIASQIVLSADQINIAGKTIYTSSKTEAISAADAAAAQSAAISAAANDATTKANNAETAAKGYADTKAASEAESKRNDIAQKLGYTDWAAMETAATQGKTIIDGGYLRTSLIEVEKLLANDITLDANGYIESSNYAEDQDSTPTAGFKLDAANNIIKAGSGVFANINIKGNSQFEGLIVQGTNVYFACRFAFYYYNGTLTIKQCSNPLFENSLIRRGTGQFVIDVTNPEKRKWGTPRIIPNYISDVAKTDRDVILGYFGTGDFSFQGTNPKYQVKCAGVGTWSEMLPDMSFKMYTGITFTDNNSDQFVDPVYADFLLVYV